MERGLGLWAVFFRMETPAIICYRFSHWVAKLKTPVISQVLGIVAGIFQRFVQIFVTLMEAQLLLGAQPVPRCCS